MKTLNQILNESESELKSFIVSYIDINGNDKQISLLASSETEAEGHCKYIYKDCFKVKNAKIGSLHFNT